MNIHKVLFVDFILRIKYKYPDHMVEKHGALMKFTASFI